MDVTYFISRIRVRFASHIRGEEVVNKCRATTLLGAKREAAACHVIWSANDIVEILGDNTVLSRRYGERGKWEDVK